MFCRNCGQPLNDGASFCSSCGEPVAKKPEMASGQVNPPVPQRPVMPQQPNVQTPQRNIPPPYQAPPNVPPRYPQHQNPQFQQGGAPGYGTAPKQANGGLIAVIAVLSLLVLAGGFLLFVKPGYLLHREPGSVLQNSKAEPAVTAVPGGTANERPALTEQAIQPGAEAKTQAPPDIPQGLEPQEELIGGNYDPMTEPWALSTSERPSFAEFEWCYGQYGWLRQAPENAYIISDPQVYNGSWKAMVIYNPDDSGGIFTRELDNISVVVDENNQVQLTIDWYLLAPDYSEYSNEEDMEDTVFSGAVTNTGISASGPATVTLDNLWHDGERQYAVGFIIPQNGVTAYLAMVRP